MGLCAAIAHFSIDEVSLWLDVLNFLCSVGFKPAREEAAAYMLCTVSLLTILTMCNGFIQPICRCLLSSTVSACCRLFRTL